MTNIQRLVSLLGFAPPENSAEGALLDAGIDSDGTYVSASINSIKKASLEVMELILTTADTGNSEVGWTAKYDRSAILKRIASIKEDLGIIDAIPVIKGKQPW